MRKNLCLIIISILSLSLSAKDNLLIGAYYYDGWAGENPSFKMDGIHAPIGLTKKMFNEYSEREPIWGWRDDDVNIMERQIDLASKNGIDFFIFCWYWSEENGKIADRYIRQKAEHNSLYLFMQARNKHKMKFAIMIVNHPEGAIVGADRWTQFIEYCSNHYFNDSQYLKLEGKPFVSFFLGKEPSKCLDEMETVAREKGYPGLYTVSCGYRNKSFSANSWYCTFETAKEAVEKDYSSLVEYTRKQWYAENQEIIIIPYCMAGWDRRPWIKDENFLYYTNRTPNLFLQNMKEAVDFLFERKTKNPIVLIYAWNEYGEGGYIAPTKGDKRGKLLRQVKKAKKYGRSKL